MNPRPKMQRNGVYRFIGARWLSGTGVSTASVGSVFWKKSLVPSKPGTKQAPVGVGNSCCFGAASTTSRVPLLTQRERNCRYFRQLWFLSGQRPDGLTCSRNPEHPSRIRDTPFQVPSIFLKYSLNLKKSRANKPPLSFPLPGRRFPVKDKLKPRIANLSFSCYCEL